MHINDVFRSPKGKTAIAFAVIWPTVEIIDWIGRIRTAADMASLIWAHIADIRVWIGPVSLLTSAVLVISRMRELRRPKNPLEAHFDSLNRLGKEALAKILTMPAGIRDSQLRTYLF